MIARADNFVRMKKSSPDFMLQFCNSRPEARCWEALAMSLQTPSLTGAEPFDEFNGFWLEFRVGLDRV
jgi:hypothetical protein